MQTIRFILLPVLLLLCFSMKSYCQIPEVMVGDTAFAGLFIEPYHRDGSHVYLCLALDLTVTRRTNNNFSYTIKQGSKITNDTVAYWTEPDTVYALFNSKSRGIEYDSVSFHAFWQCGASGHNVFILEDSIFHIFSAKGIDSVVGIKIKDSSFIFPIDTQTRKYEPKTEPFYFYSNIADSVLFDSWQLVIDPSAKISFKVDSNSSALSEYRSLPFTRKKQLNFTFSTSLPVDSARTYQATMKTRVRYNGVDSIYSNSFIIVLPAAPKSGVHENINDDIIFTINPNPASKLTTLRLTTTSLEPATIEVYDLLGNRVSVVTENFYCHPTEEFSFNAHSLPVGEYFVRLSVGKTILSKKMVTK